MRPAPIVKRQPIVVCSVNDRLFVAAMSYIVLSVTDTPVLWPLPLQETNQY